MALVLNCPKCMIFVSMCAGLTPLASPLLLCVPRGPILNYFSHCVYIRFSFLCARTRVYIYYLHEFGYRRSRSIKMNVTYILLYIYKYYNILQYKYIYTHILIQLYCIVFYTVLSSTFVDDITQWSLRPKLTQVKFNRSYHDVLEIYATHI